MAFIDPSDIAEREMIPGFHARFVHTDHVTVSYWRIEAGHSLPEHSHPHEQITSLVKGQFLFTLEGETRLIQEGAVVVIPAHGKHSAVSVTDCYAIDVFYPVREDYR